MKYAVTLKDLLYITVISIIFTTFFIKCSNDKNNQKLSIQNFKALHDSIEVLKNKNGVIEYRKAILETEKNDLKKLNANLYEEVKKIKVGTPEVIIKTEILYLDTNKRKTVNKYENLGENNHSLSWDFKNEISEIEGFSRFHLNKDNTITPDSSFITKEQHKINLTVAIVKEDDGIRRISVIPSDPRFKVNKIDGAIINKEMYTSKKPVVTLGVQAGYGFSNSMIPTPYVGIGIQYNIITLFSKKVVN